MTPHLVFKCDPSSCDDLLAFGAFGCEFLFEASDAVDVCLVWDDEWFATNLTFANNALETTVVPLFALVLHLEKIIRGGSCQQPERLVHNICFRASPAINQ